MKRQDGMPWAKVVDCGRIVKGHVYSDRSGGAVVQYLPDGTKVYDTDGNERELEEGSRWFVDADGLFRQTRKSRVKGDNIDSLKLSLIHI